MSTAQSATPASKGWARARGGVDERPQRDQGRIRCFHCYGSRAGYTPLVHVPRWQVPELRRGYEISFTAGQHLSPLGESVPRGEAVTIPVKDLPAKWRTARIGY